VCAGSTRSADPCEPGRAGALAAAVAARAAALAASDAPSPAWTAFDRAFDPRTPSPAQRAASRAQGRAAGLAASGMGGGRRASAPPDRARRGGGVRGGEPADAAGLAASQAETGPASAALRLLGLDPLALTAALVRLAVADAVDRVAAEASRYGDEVEVDLPAPAAPMLDLLSQAHARSEVRLFAS
jgi:urease accessory protein